MRHAQEAGLTGPAARGVESFVRLLDEIGLLAADEANGPGDLLQAVMDGSGYLAELEAEMEGSVEAAGRLENIGEMIGSAREFTRVDEFLEQVVRDAAQPQEVEATVVRRSEDRVGGFQRPPGCIQVLGRKARRIGPDRQRRGRRGKGSLEHPRHPRAEIAVPLRPGSPQPPRS